MAKKQEKQSKIPKTTGWLMLSFAVLVDIASASLGLMNAVLPPIGPVIAVLFGFVLSFSAWFTLWFWMKLRGVNFLERLAGGRYTTRKVTAWVVVPLLELVPYMNVLLPGWTISTFLTISFIRLEDKGVEEGLVSEEQLEYANVIARDFSKGRLSREEIEARITKEIRRRAKDKERRVVRYSRQKLREYGENYKATA